MEGRSTLLVLSHSSCVAVGHLDIFFHPTSLLISALEDPVQLGSFVCREATVGDKSMLP